MQIPVKLAYFALVEHDIKASPLWDTEAQQFVGMMTTTDFIHILRYHYKKNEAQSPMLDLSDLPIYKWRELVASLNQDAPERIHQEIHNRAALGPEDDLYLAGQQLRAHRELHQIPIIDVEQKSVLSVLTYRRLVQYLCSNLKEQRRLFDQPIIELGIGTFANIHTVSSPLRGQSPCGCPSARLMVLRFARAVLGSGGNAVDPGAEYDADARRLFRSHRE